MIKKPNPHLMRVGTDAHYEDARYYDHAYSARREDVDFYAAFAKQHGGPVLELGVGTGRVAIEIAKLGISLVGVDRMPSMLHEFKARLADEPKSVRSQIALKKGDLRTFRMPKKFPLVISPFNVFMHLYERVDLEQAFETVHAHLAKDGTFLFDVLMPDHGALHRDPDRIYRCPMITNPSDNKKYTYTESFDYDAVTQVQMVTMAFSEVNHPENTYITPLAHRQFFPAELEALLHYNGFDVQERWGDYNRGPLKADSESQIMVCKKKKRRA